MKGKWWGWLTSKNKSFVKITRRIGEDEIAEISFNTDSTESLLNKLDVVLDFMMRRMEDRNQKILDAAAELGKAQAGKAPRVVK